MLLYLGQGIYLQEQVLPDADMTGYTALPASYHIPTRTREHQAGGRVTEDLMMEDDTRREKEVSEGEEAGLEPPRRRQRTAY